jgi:hypothetical protein
MMSVPSSTGAAATAQDADPPATTAGETGPGQSAPIAPAEGIGDRATPTIPHRSGIPAHRLPPSEITDP